MPWRASSSTSSASAQALRALRTCAVGSPDPRSAAVSDFWVAATAAYGALIERVPDSDFYRTFYNSVTRDLFGTVGVNPSVEFCATQSGRASGSVPIRVYPAAGSLQSAVSDVLADLPFAKALATPELAVRRVTTELGRHFETRPPSAAPESIEMIEPLFYRAGEAFLVGRLIGDSAVTPLVISFRHGAGRRAGRSPCCCRATTSARSSAMPTPISTSTCRWSAPRSRCCARSCRASPSTSSTRCWAAPSRARRSAISRCGAISTARSTPSCTRRASAAWS